GATAAWRPGRAGEASSPGSPALGSCEVASTDILRGLAGAVIAQTGYSRCEGDPPARGRDQSPPNRGITMAQPANPPVAGSRQSWMSHICEISATARFAATG